MSKIKVGSVVQINQRSYCGLTGVVRSITPSGEGVLGNHRFNSVTVEWNNGSLEPCHETEQIECLLFELAWIGEAEFWPDGEPIVRPEAGQESRNDSVTS